MVTPPVERSLDARVSRVTRVAGSIAGADVTGITVLGLPRSTLAGIGGWRSDFAAAGPRELARDVDPGRPVALRGPRIPDDARRLSLRMVVKRTQLGLVAYVAARDGSFVPIRLARNEGPRPAVLVAPVPAAARGGRLVAFRLEPPPKLEERGADSGAPAVGSVELGPPRVDGRPLTDYGDWLGTVGVDRLQRDGALRFHVTLTNEVDTYLRPRQPTDGLQIPAVVSPFLATLAGPDRVLGVTVNGEQLQFRVAAVARRFPGVPQNVSSDFLVADRPALESALNTSTPGSGFATELWLDTRPVAARGGRGPPAEAAVHGARRLVALAARALAAGRADRPRGGGDAGDRGADGHRARAARARAGRGLGAARRGAPSCSTSRPRAWHRRACGASFGLRALARRAGRRGRRRRSPGSCSRCSSSASSS